MSNVIPLRGFLSGTQSATLGEFQSGDKIAATFLDINKTDLQLDQVDNTSDLNKPISTAVASAIIDLSTHIQFLDSSGGDEIFFLDSSGSGPFSKVDGSMTTFPSGNFLTATSSTTSLPRLTVTDALRERSLIDSPFFTGIPKAPTAVVGDTSQQIANTIFVQNQNMAPYSRLVITFNNLQSQFLRLSSNHSLSFTKNGGSSNLIQASTLYITNGSAVPLLAVSSQKQPTMSFRKSDGSHTTLVVT